MNFCLAMFFCLAVLTASYAQTESEAPKSFAKNLAKNLEDSFQAALKKSEVIATQSELIIQAEQRYTQAIGSILPSISGSASYTLQPSSGSNSFSPAVQPLVKLSASQPIFQGFKEFAGLKLTQHQIMAQKSAKWNATILLFQDVAQNFYTILTLEEDLKNLKSVIGLYNQRIAELKQFVSIGRSRQSEVLTAQTQMENLSAQADQIESQIKINREVLFFLTGFDAEILLSDEEIVPANFLPLSQYLFELEKRPDIQTANETVQASEESIRVAQAGHYPFVNLLGNYYFSRTGIQQNINWDAQLALTLPLFSGGIIESNVQIARSQRNQSDLTLDRTKRLAHQEISTYYQTLVSDQNQYKTFSRITQLAEKNYKAELQDYKHGLVNNIDVLQALASFQESQRSLDRARFSLKLDYAKIEASVAHRPKPTEGSLNP